MIIADGRLALSKKPVTGRSSPSCSLRVAALLTNSTGAVGVPMRVLITGHHGYVGSVLTPLLTAEGHEVIGLDVDYFADCVFGTPPVEIPTLNVDIRDVRPEHC